MHLAVALNVGPLANSPVGIREEVVIRIGEDTANARHVLCILPPVPVVAAKPPFPFNHATTVLSIARIVISREKPDPLVVAADRAGSAPCAKSS